MKTTNQIEQKVTKEAKGKRIQGQNSDLGAAASNPYSYSRDLCELCDLLFKMFFFAAFCSNRLLPRT